MDLEFGSNHSLEKEEEQVNSLNDILNSITPTSISIHQTDETNGVDDTNEANETNGANETNIIKMSRSQMAELTNHIQTVDTNYTQSVDTNFSREQIQLFSHPIDRKIGNYLMNELEKKQSYIEELEEVVKFQEKEIGELKSKIDTIGKLEILAKLKSGLEENHKNNFEDKKLNVGDDDTTYNQNKPKVVQVKKQSVSVIESNKPNQINQMIQEAQSKNNDNQSLSSSSSYPSVNPDLVLGSSSFKTKTKSIPKEEEEPRYNGVVILDKPKREPEIKIVMDYETDTIESSEKSSDLLKQRRRARKL
jgi:hypothetical protein